MSTLGEFYVPDDDVLRELGRMQVLHSQLDHMLRLVIKRTVGISIDHPGYWNETRGMSKALRDHAREFIDKKYRDNDDRAGTLNKVLDDAEDATFHRNRALHSVWMKMPGAEPVLHDRDHTLKEHVSFQLPTVEELRSVCERFVRVQRVLDHLTR
jgi:hypothetical protein